MRNTIVLASLCLTACAVGPDFKNPDAPGTSRYAPAPPQSERIPPPAEAAPDLYVDGEPVPNRWWELFQCESLNALVEQALAHSPTTLAARARLREAQEKLYAKQAGTFYPAIDAQLGVTRQSWIPQPSVFLIFRPRRPLRCITPKSMSFIPSMYSAGVAAP